MRNLLAILMVISAATCHTMNQDTQKKFDEEKKSIEADTQKPQALKTYKDHDDHDDWHEFDENTESLSARKLSRFRTNPKPSQSASVNHYNLVSNIKANPDAFFYDSDEMPELIDHLESKTPAKN
jgi:hypothetical protein